MEMKINLPIGKEMKDCKNPDGPVGKQIWNICQEVKYGNEDKAAPMKYEIFGSRWTSQIWNIWRLEEIMGLQLLKWGNLR